jgi:hypothetical protein
MFKLFKLIVHSQFFFLQFHKSDSFLSFLFLNPVTHPELEVSDPQIQIRVRESLHLFTSLDIYLRHIEEQAIIFNIHSQI